jgi:hypothetical protein
MELGLKNINVNKSAVAFSFCFPLQGTSIGNGQQGITHNTKLKTGRYSAKTFPPCY